MIYFKKMNYHTLQKIAREAGLSLRKGYQRYLDDRFGYVLDEEGKKVIGYDIFDYQKNFFLKPTYPVIADHPFSLTEAFEIIKEYSAERGVNI